MLVDRILKGTVRIWKVADSTRNVTDSAIKVEDTLRGWIKRSKDG